MKKILILLLTICSITSFGQVFMQNSPPVSPTAERINQAMAGAFVASGTNTYTITFVNGSYSYTALTGLALAYTFPNPNTTSSTLNFDGLGAKNIQKWESGVLVDVVADDLIGTVRLRYDGTQFVMEGGTGSGGGGSSTFVGLTDGPGSFSGAAGQSIVVNPGETALEYYQPITGVNAFGDEGVVRWDATDHAIQGSSVTMDDSGNMSGLGSMTHAAGAVIDVYGLDLNIGSTNATEVKIGRAAGAVKVFGSAISTNQIAYVGASNVLGSLTTATYPSLTELSYGKGVTSAIQTQINGKQATFGTQTANTVYSGPSSGGAATPTFRALVNTDLTSALNVARTATSATSTLQSDNLHTVYLNGTFNVTVDALTDETIITYINIGSGTVTLVNGTATVSGPSTIAAGGTLVLQYETTTAPLSLTGSGGTVTSVTSANGDATVATTTTTPVITIVSAPKLTTSRTIGTLTGDGTTAGSSFDGTANNTNSLTLATVNGNVGSFGSATQVAVPTVNAKGLITAISNTTITPAVGSITGLGTSVATALAVNVGTAGAFVVNGGALGTPSSGTATNLTGLPISGITGLGTGVGTWLATPSWTNFNSAITGTAPFWSLASGGALTAANTISGSFNLGFTNTSTGIGVAPGSITANTRLDVAGSGNTSSTWSARFRNSSGTLWSNWRDDMIYEQLSAGDNIDGFRYVATAGTTTRGFYVQTNNTTAVSSFSLKGSSSNYFTLYSSLSSIPTLLVSHSTGRGMRLGNEGGDATVLDVLNLSTSTASNVLSPSNSTERNVITSAIGFQPASGSGSAPFGWQKYTGTWVDAFSGTAAMSYIDFNATLNTTTGSRPTYFMRYRPNVTATAGAQYAFIDETSGARNGLGVAAPTAKLHLSASTTAANTASLKINEGSRQTSAEDGTINYVSNNLEFVETSTVYTLAKTLTNTATLDFGSTLAGAVTDLTITVTGAADGDAVSIGVPNGSYPATGTFTAWVSAANTVTIRYANNSLTLSQDPASGTFRASVIKY